MSERVKVILMATVLVAFLTIATTFIVKTSVKLNDCSVMKQVILI